MIEKDEEKEIITSKQVTTNIIAKFIAFKLLFLILSQIIVLGFKEVIDTALLIEEATDITFLLIIVFFYVIICISWKLSFYFVLKKFSVLKSDVKTIIKNLIIFSVVGCLIFGVYLFFVIELLDRSSPEPVIIVTEATSEDYIKERMEEGKKSENQVYIYGAIFEVGLIIINLCMIKLQKNALMDSAV